MGSFDQIVLASLKDGSRKSFKEILAKGGLSHNTLKRYLRRLMDQGLVLRAENVKNERGRPEYAYYLTPKLRQRVSLTLTEPYTSLVTLTFARLKQICKHNKSGFCQAKRRNCSSYVCPHIMRSK
jgi:predicted ArsR family transcriptional regulator